MINSVFIRELNEYSERYLSETLKIDEKVLNKLMKHSVVKYDDEKNCFKFDYVGVIILDEVVIKCYPKYIHDDKNKEDDFKQVLKTIKKYKNSDRKHKIYNEDFFYGTSLFEDVSFNRISLMLFFIEDYFENGLYSNIKNILEINGDGEIDWNRTVNENVAIIQDNKPYYVDFQTKSKTKDLFNYFRLLHECIITECSNYLKKVGLLDIFDLIPVELSDKCLDDFGDDDVILNKLNNELNVEFNTHKQNLLKSMISYVSKRNEFNNENYLTFYGTTKYNIIWEEMCSKIFSNQLNEKLGDLGLDTEKFSADKTLMEIIDKPLWIYKNVKEHRHSRTFEPDIISIYKNNFIILDAKYYDLKFDEYILDGEPGLGDITKQYLYQLAFEDFIDAHKFSVRNALLFPTYEDIENKGCVKLKIFSKFPLKNIQVTMFPVRKVYHRYLEDIQVIMLPAMEINELYLENKKLSISYLNL